MTDRLHDHTTFGFRRGCLACAQVEADIARSARALAKQDQTAVGDALWERVMEGDPTAVPAYSKWMEHERTLLGLNPSEGGAALQGITSVPA